MHERFTEYIKNHHLLQTGSRILLAVSGGIDSMAMAELFKISGYNFAIAHCNFQLRGGDSEKDQELVTREAKRLGVECYTESFNTMSFARENKLSVQMAARELRYSWLEKTRAGEGYDLIATAHHLDDSIETMLINLLRGTGVKGLRGIPKKTGHIIRPLLFASRGDIESFALSRNISYREDRTNKETKYLRNRLRHEVIPLLEKISPGLRENMTAFFDRMESTSELLEMTRDEKAKELISQHGNEMHIDIKRLAGTAYSEALLFLLLQEYDFPAPVCRDIHSSLENQPGKRFCSPTHTAIKDRDKLIVFPSAGIEEPCEEKHLIEGDKELTAFGRRFMIEYGEYKRDTGLPSGPHALMADMNKLSFPLLIRKWEPGDRMVPLGMRGKKKISDILTDEKLPLHKKEKALVLESKGKIVWLVGIRADNRFRVTARTKEYIRVY